MGRKCLTDFIFNGFVETINPLMNQCSKLIRSRLKCLCLFLTECMQACIYCLHRSNACWRVCILGLRVGKVGGSCERENNEPSLLIIIERARQ